MKKRLIGLVLIMSMVLGLSVAVYAEGGSRPFPRPPGTMSVHLDDIDM